MVQNNIGGDIGFTKAHLSQKLDELGVKDNNQKEKILSIFDEVDKDETIYDVKHNDGILDGAEMGEFMQRARGLFSKIADDLEDSFKKTGRYVARYANDKDFDGKIDEDIRFTYDENGNNVRTIEREYDKEGRMTRYAELNPKNGKVKSEKLYEYDKNSKPVRIQLDTNGDGKVDSIVQNKYDKNGRWAGALEDLNGDGNVDRETQQEYDKDGRRTRFVIDNEANGTTDAEQRLEYDSKGRLVHATWDSNGDGKIDEETQYEYDSNGNRTRTELKDTNGDGVMDRRQKYFD